MTDRSELLTYAQFKDEQDYIRHLQHNDWDICRRCGGCHRCERCR